MQRMKQYVLPLLAVMTLTTACSKNEDTEPNLPATNYMTAIIDGSYWSADDVARTTNGGDTLRFTGSRNSSKPITIQLVINRYRGPGVYRLNDTLASAAYTDVSGTYKSYTGSVSVTADDADHISAGFQVNAQSGGTYKDIANGQLNIKK